MNNLNKAIKFASNFTGNRSGSQGKKTKSPGALTIQHDYRKTYSKKRMPKRKRKQWTKFVKKVQAVNLRDRGLITALYNKRLVAAAVAPTDQAIIACHLYGHNGAAGTDETGQQDLKTLIDNNEDLRGLFQVDNSGGFGTIQQTRRTTVSAVEKIMFESAILDMTLYNGNAAGALEVDIYSITYNKFNVNNETTLLTSFKTGDPSDIAPMQYDNTVAGYFANIKLTDRGATPFELGHIIGRHGIRILSKEKVYISAGQSINKQYRDAKNRYFDPRGLLGVASDQSSQSTNTYRYKDWTKTFLIVAKNVDPGTATTTSFSVGCTRSYKYTYEGLKINKNYVASF